MNGKPIEALWIRVARQLRIVRAAVYGALCGEWLAKLSLKDHYAVARAGKQPRA